jgi:hypothetical protein
MLTLFVARLDRSGTTDPDHLSSDASDFAYRLRRARLQELIDNPEPRRWFAYSYVAVDR